MDNLEKIASILIRCFWIGIAFVLFTAVVVILFPGVFRIHEALFGIEMLEINKILYFMLGLMKILLFIFFLVPYIAIKLVIRKG